MCYTIRKSHYEPGSFEACEAVLNRVDELAIILGTNTDDLDDASLNRLTAEAEQDVHGTDDEDDRERGDA